MTGRIVDDFRKRVADAPAPIWHTILLLLYLLVPISRWPGAKAVMLRAEGAGKPGISLFEMVFQLGGVALVCVGLHLNRTQFRELVGKRWATFRDLFFDMYLGVVFCLLAIGLSLLTYFILGASYDGPSRILPSTSSDLLLFIPLAVVGGICEEVMFRGYLFKQGQSFTGNMELALVLQALVFIAAHGYTQTISGVIDKFLFATTFGILANWRKSLLPGIIAHVLLDVSIGIVAVLSA